MNKVFQAYLRGLLVAVISVLCFVGSVAANNYVVVIDAGHGGKDMVLSITMCVRKTSISVWR